MDKILKIVEKINKYAHLDYTLKQYIMFVLISFLVLFLVFYFFEKTWSMVKDNIWKWDNVTFVKLTVCMLIPLLSIIFLNVNLFSDIHLNGWFRFLSMFFIISIFPYLFMIVHHLFYLMFKKMIIAISKKD